MKNIQIGDSPVVRVGHSDYAIHRFSNKIKDLRIWTQMLLKDADDWIRVGCAEVGEVVARVDVRVHGRVRVVVVRHVIV